MFGGRGEASLDNGKVVEEEEKASQYIS